MRQLRRAIMLIAATIVFASPCAAKIVKFEILKVESPAFEGRTFGTVGTYDRILARATIAVAPDDPHNKIIVDLDREPRNAQGLVEAVTDVEILRPTVAANGNRTLFYEVLNRGSKLGLALFNDIPAVTNDLVKATDAGNGFLMNRGYTVVWSGWQGDIIAGGGRMTFSPPVALGISVGTDKPGNVRLFDLATLDFRRELINLNYSTGPGAFAPDGKTLATGRGFSFKLWDPTTGKTRAVVDVPHVVRGIA